MSRRKGRGRERGKEGREPSILSTLGFGKKKGGEGGGESARQAPSALLGRLPSTRVQEGKGEKEGTNLLPLKRKKTRGKREGIPLDRPATIATEKKSSKRKGKKKETATTTSSSVPEGKGGEKKRKGGIPHDQDGEKGKGELVRFGSSGHEAEKEKKKGQNP